MCCSSTCESPPSVPHFYGRKPAHSLARTRDAWPLHLISRTKGTLFTRSKCGNAIVLKKKWGSQLTHYQSNPSQLSVTDEALLKGQGGRLQILAMFWPFLRLKAIVIMPAPLFNIGPKDLCPNRVITPSAGDTSTPFGMKMSLGVAVTAPRSMIGPPELAGNPDETICCTYRNAILTL